MGATGGIGAATVLRLAHSGWDMIAAARSQEKADVLVAAAAGRSRTACGWIWRTPGYECRWWSSVLS
ncbi:hypothetical protein [Streptomyces longwoodensis]|uniref:hypothetical protein n=1 Tax=Streptomyces longwoodensis TaxID=68231 RepID=UPI0033EDE517